jgi:hypothetical protein
VFRAPDASSSNPYTSRGKETPDDVPESFHVAQQVQKGSGAAVHAGDMEVSSIANVSGTTARQILCGVSCDACKTCLKSQVLLSANVFTYFKDCRDTEQSPTYPSGKLVKMASLMGCMVADVAHLNSVEQH